MMKGRPGSVMPTTSSPPPWSPARYHSDGACKARCMSLARMGLPDFVREPLITHAFDACAIATRDSNWVALEGSSGLGTGSGAEGLAGGGVTGAGCGGAALSEVSAVTGAHSG